MVMQEQLAKVIKIAKLVQKWLLFRVVLIHHIPEKILVALHFNKKLFSKILSLLANLKLPLMNGMSALKIDSAHKYQIIINGAEECVR